MVINLILFFHLFIGALFISYGQSYAEPVKQAEFGGQFYPASSEELSTMLDGLLAKVPLNQPAAEVFALISPHAGYGYSGQTAAYGYKLIKDKPFRTVIILGTSHHKPFNGAAVYSEGAFATSLGILPIDDAFAKTLLGKDPDVFADISAFNGEHSLEVQLPFLQKVLTNFKIVPIVIGDCTFDTCKKIAALLNAAIGSRKDVLLIASTDMYHGYDFEEADRVDTLTLNLISKMDYAGLYYALRDGKAQLCGGFGTVIALNVAQDLGDKKLEILNHTNSAQATGEKVKGQWTVGYASCAIMSSGPGADKELRKQPQAEQGENMLNAQQKSTLLKIARESISTYLKTGKKIQVTEADPLLNQKMGAFVTLNKNKALRGCIGNLIGSQPLYLTVRDMAVEAAVSDPRFARVTLDELKDIEIEISALSILERVDSADKIELGKHGVVVRKGFQSGVFLPQVATETGWSKEEFLSELCAQKAGLSADAWKDKNTELYIFTAEVFSEKGAKE